MIPQLAKKSFKAIIVVPVTIFIPTLVMKAW